MASSIAIIAGQLVVGGAERQLYLWLSHLDRSRFQPVVVTLHPGCDDYWEAPVEALGIPLIRVQRQPNRLRRLGNIIRAIRPYQPALIHGWHVFASPYAGGAAKILGAKSLGGVRGSYQTFIRQGLSAQLTILATDAIIVNSQTTAEKIQANHPRTKQKIITVQNAVDLNPVNRQESRAQMARMFGIAPDCLVVGSVGRLEYSKRFDLLLEVITSLRQSNLDFHFILIGDGPERARLAQIVSERDLAHFITLAGEIPHASDLIAAFDIFCFTSLDEGSPNAVLEAAAAEVPVVAWRLPFIEEALDGGRAGRLVEAGDVAAFANAVIQLAQAPGARARLGAASKDYVLTQFSLPRYVQRMSEVYEEILARD